MMVHFRIMIVLLLMAITQPAHAQQDSFSLYFATGKAQIDALQRARLDSALYSGHFSGNVRLRITGYADEPGSSSLNKQLAQRRAAALRAYLLSSGLEAGQIISCIGMGNRLKSGEDALQRRADLAVLHERCTAAVPKPEVATPASDPGLQDLGKMKIDEVLELKGLYFNVSNSIITKSSFPILDQLVEVLKGLPEIRIRIEGHICCGHAAKSANIGGSWFRLSEERAKSVMNYLMQGGISEDRLSYKGLGFTKPKLFPERNPADENRNRRVEIRILSNAGAAALPSLTPMK